MKKILLMTFEYPKGGVYCGGVGQIVKQCRQALLDMGYEVHVLISSHFLKKFPVKVLLPDETLLRYPDFHSFQNNFNWHEFNYIIQNFVNWTRLLHKIKSHRGPKPKIFYHFHSILRRERDSGFKIMNRFLLNQEKMIKISDKVICPSLYEYDNFVRYFPHFSEKVVVVENTIETFPQDKKEIQNLRDKYGIKKNDIVSIYVGRLEKIKGAELLVKKIVKILKKHKNLKIFVVGKVLERNIYKRLISAKKRFPHQIYYIRYMQKKMLFQYYYLSNIFVNTSFSESFSLATHEAALCGDVLLLSEIPAFDRFRDAAQMFSHQDKNDNDFTSQYERLLKNRKLWGKLSEKSVMIAKDMVAHNRLKQDLSELFII
jgi:glycosyltransferase involved in cell wall biosynthesis